MTRSRKRRPSDMDPGGQGNPYPQSKNRQRTNPPSRPGRQLDSNSSRSFREPRSYNGSGSSYDRRSPQRGLVDSYRPRHGSIDSYRPRTARPLRTWDSYRPDPSRYSNSRAATNEPVTSRRADSARSRGRSPLRRSRQREASDERSLGRTTRKPLPDGRVRNGIPNDARSRSPRSRDHADGQACSQRFRDGSRRSPLHARKRIAVEVRNGPPGDNTRARNPSEKCLTYQSDPPEFSLTKDSPTLLPESHNHSQPTKEPRSLGENNSVTSQPDTSVPDPREREGSLDDASYSSDSRAFSNDTVYSQREGSSSRLEKSGVLPVFRYEIPIPKLEPNDFLPESTSADRGLYLKAGTPDEICVWKPDSAPNPGSNDSSWRTANFTPSIWELVHGRARQAKNRASAALLPDNVPLFKPKTSTSGPSHLRSRKTKFRGTLEEYYQMLSDKKKKEHNDTTLPTDSREDDDPNFSSSSEEEDYDPNTLKDTWMFRRMSAGLKSQWGTSPEIEAQSKSKNGLLSKGILYTSGPSERTHNTPLIEAKNGLSLAKAQQENPPKSGAQVVSENGTVAKDTLGAGSVPNGSAHSMAPIKRLAIARGKQLRPELQAMARLRASASQSVPPERECAGGHLQLASKGLSVASLEISGGISEKDDVPTAPNK